MKKYNVIFIGRVQGVGFRYQVLMNANKYDVLGNVKNEYDGSVVANFQGEFENINLLIKAMKEYKFAKIDEIKIKEEKLEDYKDFKILN